MKYFTIGPVQMSAKVAANGGRQALYFRDDDFAQKVISAQRKLMEFAGASESSRIAILSSCGTSGMEASVINFTRIKDPVVVINGGGFGKRFVDIATYHKRQVMELKVTPGQSVDYEKLENLVKKKPKAVFVNVHETSTGQKYDLDIIGSICKKYDVLLICDAIGSFLCDPLNMVEQNVNVVIFSSNKGLALSPGATFVIADERANCHLESSESYSLDLKRHFDGADRGQPPFTSPISVLMQLFSRLDEIEKVGGVDKVISHMEMLAKTFRKKIQDNGFQMFPSNPSNAITAIVLKKGTSDDLYDFLKDKYGYLINKSAWVLGIDIPRISHVGDLTMQDHKDLAAAIKVYSDVY